MDEVPSRAKTENRRDVISIMGSCVLCRNSKVVAVRGEWLARFEGP